MPPINISGVNINFPFDPYECQISYMEKVVTCLQKAHHGILESPTGTGKTLCLLCSCLAWLGDKKAQITSQRWKLSGEIAAEEHHIPVIDNAFKDTLANQLDQAVGSWSGELAPPRIIYASRTHSQLTQAVQELKRTAYSHVKVCVLGSREQMCIHPQVMKEENNSTKVHLCRAKVSSRTCHFYNNLETGKANFENKIMDIEDLVQAGQKHNCCPYYAARELRSEADIIFMPYNYLLDPKSRRAHGVELNGNVVIFDEAHNLERICEESASFDWKSSEIASAIRELTQISEKILEQVEAENQGFDMEAHSGLAMGDDFTLQEVLELKAQLAEIETLLDKFPLSQPEKGVTKPGSYIFELFENAKLTFRNKSEISELIDKLVSFMSNDSSGSGVFHSKGSGLSKYGDIIKIVFSRDPADEHSSVNGHQRTLAKHYKVHIHEQIPWNRKSKKASGWDAPSEKQSTRVLSYWCFSPGYAMEELKAQGVKCIILTSGTLSPLSSFKFEMGLEFKVELENPHVIQKHQVWVGTVGKGPDGTTLSSAYDTRFKETYQSSLGNTVVNFARVVPDGLLLFFPSYPVMDKCLEHWQQTNIWNRIEQYKPLFVEPKGKSEFHTAMTNYYDKVQDTTANGAVFAAVCRGKVSEGLDFADTNGRAVVITGLPYPPRMDSRVVLKMQYLDENRSQGGTGLTGQDWYKQQAFRAVNQAVGRVIRHKDDYGAILLCDNRFNYPNSKSQLPSWMRPYIQSYNNFGAAIRDMKLFFNTAEKLMPSAGPAKKKIRAAEPGCQGAHFSYSSVRSVAAGSMPVERASTIAVHVPSLQSRRDTEEVSMARLKTQYEGSQASSSTGCKVDLLDALDRVKQQGGLDMAADSDDTRFQVPSAKTSTKENSVPPKKKILIKKSGSGSEINSKSSLQSAEVYLQKVKATLSADSYSRFNKSLYAYHATHNYSDLVTVLADIFTDSPEKFDLFRGCYRFVVQEQKDQFNQLCIQLVGKGCRSSRQQPQQQPQQQQLQQQDVVAKKRTLSDSLNDAENQDKKRKITEVKCDKSQSMNTKEAPHLTTAVSLSSQHLDSKTHLNCDQLTTLPASNSIASVASCSSSFSSRLGLSKTNLSGEGEGSAAAENTTGRYEDYVRMTKEAAALCPRCKKNVYIPLKASCEHIACMECWKLIIREEKKCPVCGKPAKRKHLRRVFFYKGADFLPKSKTDSSSTEEPPLEEPKHD